MVSFSSNVDVCEFFVEQPIKCLMTCDDGLSCLYDDKLICLCRDENPCYRLSLMIKSWIESSASDRLCGHWFATDIAQEHLGNIVFNDTQALFNECDDCFFEFSLRTLYTALVKKIERMTEGGMTRTLFWNPDISVKNGSTQHAIIHGFYEQFTEFILDSEEITRRLRCDEKRTEEIEAIEREIINLTTRESIKCGVSKSGLYKHP